MLFTLKYAFKLLNRWVISTNSCSHDAYIGLARVLLTRWGLFDQTNHSWKLLCWEWPGMTIAYNVCRLHRGIMQGLYRGIRCVMTVCVRSLGHLARPWSQSHHLSVVLAVADWALELLWHQGCVVVWICNGGRRYRLAVIAESIWVAGQAPTFIMLQRVLICGLVLKIGLLERFHVVRICRGRPLQLLEAATCRLIRRIIASAKLLFNWVDLGQALPASHLSVSIDIIACEFISSITLRRDIDRGSVLGMEATQALVLNLMKLEFTTREAVLRIDRLSASGGQAEPYLALRHGVKVWLLWHDYSFVSSIVKRRCGVLVNFQSFDRLWQVLQERL